MHGSCEYRTSAGAFDNDSDFYCLYRNKAPRRPSMADPGRWAFKHKLLFYRQL